MFTSLSQHSGSDITLWFVSKKSYWYKDTEVEIMLRKHLGLSFEKEAWHCTSPGCSVDWWGIDASVMDLLWTLVCVVMLLSVCVRCEKSQTDSDQDQASRLRHMWLLSIKESKMRQKGRSGLGSYKTFYWFLLKILIVILWIVVKSNLEHSTQVASAFEWGGLRKCNLIRITHLVMDRYLAHWKSGRFLTVHSTNISIYTVIQEQMFLKSWFSCPKL